MSVSATEDVRAILRRKETELVLSEWGVEGAVNPTLDEGLAAIPPGLLRQPCHVYTAAAVLRVK